MPCQACGGKLTKVLSLGYLPPPNEMPKFEEYEPEPQIWLPTDLMFCEGCELAQLGYVPDQRVAFPEDYPYRSGATPALRRNFENLAISVNKILPLSADDLVVDIGSNDGTLLECFGTRRLGIEPTIAAMDALDKGIPTRKEFFTGGLAEKIVAECGTAKVVTCANCFAHMSNIHDVIIGIKRLIGDDGIFISESHYLIDLVHKLQYDTIYAEHLRYYSVRSLTNLLGMHGMEVFAAERIPTHGGSIRIYARNGAPVAFKTDEPDGEEMLRRLRYFAGIVQSKKRYLVDRLDDYREVVGIGAPSRASTVISYARLDQSIIRYVCEQTHSHKIGRYMPGTDIPVVDEAGLYEEQPEAAILFSWHLADELIPKIRAKGYRGDIILPCSGDVIGNSSAMATE